MAHCVNCSSFLGDAEQPYYICDIGPEIISIIEQNIGYELTDDGEMICQQCFDNMAQALSQPFVQRDPNEPENELIPLPYETNVCVWCRSSLYQRRCHDIPHGRERNIISEYISPRQIPPGGLVCHACWEYARLIRRQNAENIDQPGGSGVPNNHRVPNTNICVWCQVSLNHRRRHTLPEGPITAEIASQIYPRQIPVGGLVCYACWVRARRNVERQGQNDPNNAQIPVYNRHQDDVCVWCLLALHRRRTHSLPHGPIRDIVANRIHPREIPDNALLCLECWSIAREEAEVMPGQEIPPPRNINTMSFDAFRISTRSSAHCFVPGCVRAERLTIPKYLRKHILKTKKIFVNSRSRIFAEHKMCYNWEDVINEDDFSQVLSKEEIEEMFYLSIEEDNTFANFERVDEMDEFLFGLWTGLNKVQFYVILENTPMLNNCKTPKTALGLYLMKARTGDSHERLATLLQISKAKVVRLLKVAREALTTEFVPLHLGLNHITREDIINRNLTIPEGLFGEGESRKPIIIADGTYIYLQKSSNYLFQKKTYSLHKHRNLTKPFLIVATDGHIIDVFGPYPATTSDADIMKALFQNENGDLRLYFAEDDIFILDRGFRDAIPLLTELGYKIYKPESLRVGETQLSTERANKSRCVTMCRWVVEVVNGRFKRDFKLFRSEYFNMASPHLMEDFRICAAIINAFHQEIVDRPDAQEILNRALQRLHMPNELADFVISNQINRRRARFSRINEHNPHLDIFPQMTMSDLILFALGTYQIKQARSYYGEHIRERGSFEVEVCNLEVISEEGASELLLLRARIRSRHQSNKIYNTYITISPQGHTWEDQIENYYCSCICGKRTVGCCAHVMTIVWYLGWARYQDSIEPPAPFLDGILIREDTENEIDE